MRTLHDTDVRDLSNALLALRRPGTIEQFPVTAMQVCQRLIRADVWTWNELSPDLPGPLARFLPNRAMDYDQRARLQRFGELANQHPIANHVATTGDGSARMISDFLSTEEFHATALYREVYVGERVEHQLAIALPAVLPRIVAVVASRSQLGDEFDRRDREVLDLLRPHLAQSYDLARERQWVQHLLGVAVSGLRASGTHVLLLDEPIRELTPGAAGVLFRAFGLPTGNAALPARLETWLARERSTDRGGLPEIRRPLVSNRNGRRVVARFVAGTGESDVPDALLMSEEADLSVGRVENLGLTPREAEVLRHVAEGRTNKAIATALSVEPSTVKTHLDNIFGKLGVRTRAAAVAIARDLLSAEIHHSAD